MARFLYCVVIVGNTVVQVFQNVTVVQVFQNVSVVQVFQNVTVSEYSVAEESR